MHKVANYLGYVCKKNCDQGLNSYFATIPLAYESTHLIPLPIGPQQDPLVHDSEVSFAEGKFCVELQLRFIGQLEENRSPVLSCFLVLRMYQDCNKCLIAREQCEQIWRNSTPLANI